MKSCSRVAVLVLWLAVAPVLTAQSFDTLAMLPEGESKSLLASKKSINANAEGVVPIKFSKAMEVYAQDALLTRVQTAYCDLLAEGGVPEFTISQSSSNTYFYVNNEGQRTDITEVMRRKTSEDTFDIILYSAGRRFFGDYQAVVHVQLTDAGNDETHYSAIVYAYPENAVSRFFARHLGLVERYFKKKTCHMTEIITTISCSLCNADADVAGSVQTEGQVSG